MSKILRAVYTYDNSDPGANVHTSRWIEDGGQGVIEAELITECHEQDANMPVAVILGWQEAEVGVVDLAARLGDIVDKTGDVLDKVNDVLDKCNDIMEKLDD